MFDREKERQKLIEMLSAPYPLPAEDGFPEEFDFRAAMLRAYDFFSDMSQEGKAKRAELQDHVLKDFSPEELQELQQQLFSSREK